MGIPQNPFEPGGLVSSDTDTIIPKITPLSSNIFAIANPTVNSSNSYNPQPILEEYTQSTSPTFIPPVGTPAPIIIPIAGPNINVIETKPEDPFKLDTINDVIIMNKVVDLQTDDGITYAIINDEPAEISDTVITQEDRPNAPIFENGGITMQNQNGFSAPAQSTPGFVPQQGAGTAAPGGFAPQPISPNTFNPQPAQGGGFNPQPAQGGGFNPQPAQVQGGFNPQPAQVQGGFNPQPDQGGGFTPQFAPDPNTTFNPQGGGNFAPTQNQNAFGNAHGNNAGGGQQQQNKYNIVDMFWFINKKLFAQKPLGQNEAGIITVGYNASFNNMRFSLHGFQEGSTNASSIIMSNCPRLATCNIYSETVCDLIAKKGSGVGVVAYERVIKAGNWTPNQTALMWDANGIIVQTTTGQNQTFTFQFSDEQVFALEKAFDFMMNGVAWTLSMQSVFSR